ncbi:MAG: DNA gyrase subunit A, partial [Firmicutes bacterium]|nr:DNA gyrase subunit A [Bacillota bacterium]
DELIEVKRADGDEEVLLATKKGQMIRFHENDVRATGRTSMGVRGITLDAGDEVIGMQLKSEGETVLAVTESGMGKRTDMDEFPVQHRGGKGIRYYKITPKTGDVVGFKVVKEQQDMLLITSEGVIIRLRVADVSKIGRVTSGVKLIGLDKGVKVVSVARIREDKMDE